MNITTLGTALSGATFSPCMAYRYSLTRVLNPLAGLPKIAFIGCNPSTADHEHGDPTVTRCINRAEALGAGKFYMLNLFAWRDTDPKGMRAAIEPVGIENDETIRSIALECSMVVCCWGAQGKYLRRADRVLELLRDVDLYALRITAKGWPQHPLYLPNKLEPFLWRAKV